MLETAREKAEKKETKSQELSTEQERSGAGGSGLRRGGHVGGTWDSQELLMEGNLRRGWLSWGHSRGRRRDLGGKGEWSLRARETGTSELHKVYTFFKLCMLIFLFSLFKTFYVLSFFFF